MDIILQRISFRHFRQLLLGMVLGSILISCQGREKRQPIITSNTPKVENWISEVVRKIFQDSKGNIWFGTQNGAFVYDTKELLHLDAIKSATGKGVTIKDMTEDPEGRIWFGHSDGISVLDGQGITNYYERDGLISEDVWCILADTQGKIWIGTIDGLCVFDGQQFTTFDLPAGIIDSTLGISSTKMIHSIEEDSKGTLWFSSNAGLFSYANNELVHVSERMGLPANWVNEVWEAANGALWVSTKKGLYQLVENRALNITAGKIEDGKGIGSITEDKEGNIWFVSNQHSLYIYDGKAIQAFQQSPNNQGPVVFQIYKDQADRLWFVGYGGAFRLENGKFIPITRNGPW